MKTSNHSDIDLENWKNYLGEDSDYNITTNSRWLTNSSNIPVFGNFIIPKRENFPSNDSNFHGLWIPEIPYQMIIRFTKKNDKIWSQFGGSGTDLRIGKMLNREIVINDINPSIPEIQYGDSRTFNAGNNFQMILSHPPYWDMVKYSDKPEDGSTKKTLTEFLTWWNEILDNSVDRLKDNGYFILACGNIYKNSEEIEVGEILKNMILKRGFILKQHIIKDYGESKGKNAKNYNINYYRQLKFGYGNFYGDNIYVLKKQKSKNNISNILEKFL